MDMDRKSPEITNEFRVSVVEELVMKFQDALDSLKTYLAAYYVVTATTNPPPLPLPMFSALTFPPPILGGALISYNDDDDVTEKRLDEMEIYHKQQLVEVGKIDDFMTTALDLYPKWYAGISRPINSCGSKLMEAVESYTLKLGVSPYDTNHSLDDLLSTIHKFQQLGLDAPDCAPHGK